MCTRTKRYTNEQLEEMVSAMAWKRMKEDLAVRLLELIIALMIVAVAGTIIWEASKHV